MAVVAGLAFWLGSSQYTARHFGGTHELILEKGQKLQTVTWKDDGSLWVLTRPMRETESAETFVFKEDSLFGFFNGQVKLIEQN